MRTRPFVLLTAVALSLVPALAWAQAVTSARPSAAPTPTIAPTLQPTAAAVAPAVPQPPVPPQTATPPAVAPTPQAPRPPAAARMPQPPGMEVSGINVRVDVTLTDQDGVSAPTKKSISLTVAEHSRGSVRSGVTIPVPSTTFTPATTEGGATKQQPLTSFQYRDVGLSLDVQDVSVSGSLIRLRVAVEYNPVDEKTASQEGLTPATSAPPSFARFSQSLTLTLEDGKPLVVAQSSDPVPGRNRTASLEVKATIVKAGTGAAR